MYESILVPTDGSDTAQAAVDHAIDHAKQYDAALHTLYVVEEPPMAVGSPLSDTPRRWRR
ncbi:MAG: universal stress protein [Halorientalis sp.]